MFTRYQNKSNYFVRVLFCLFVFIALIFKTNAYAAANQTTIIMSNNIKDTYDIGEHVTFTIGVSSTDGSYLTKAWCGFGYNQSTMKVVSETDTEDHVWAVSDTPTKWLYKDIEFEMTANGKCYFIAGAYEGDGKIVGYRADGSRLELSRASLVYKIGTGIYTKTSDCNLKELVVTNAETGEELKFNRDFDKNITEYTCTEGYVGLNELNISGEVENSQDHIELPEDLTIKSGMNDVAISVVASDGEKKEYVLHIEKPSVPVSVGDIRISSDTGEEVSYSFDKDTLQYELTVPSDYNSLSFNAVGLGEGCSVEYPSVTDLEPGYNIYYVRVSTDSEQRKYEFYVMKELSELSLSSLVLEGSDEIVLEFDKPFSPENTIYEARVPADVSYCTVSYTLGNTSDQVEETEDRRELVEGINFVTVTVTDGTYSKEYLVKVTRDAYEDVETIEEETVDEDKRNLLPFTSYEFKDLIPLAVAAAVFIIVLIVAILLRLKAAGKDYAESSEAASDKNERERAKRLKQMAKQRKKESEKK